MVSVRCGGAGWGGGVREALGYQGGGNWGGRKQKVEIVVMGMRLDVSERLGWVGVCVCVCVCVRASLQQVSAVAVATIVGGG